jgi:hypothetical protein
MLRSLRVSILAFTNVSLLSLALVACGSSDEDSDSNGGATTTGGSTSVGTGGDGTGNTTGGATGTGGTETSSGGASSGGGTSGTGGATATGGDSGTGGGTATTEPFSFFVTSYAAMQELSGSQNGFGGDLRFGETGDGAGLRGADKICTTIAEKSMPGNGKTWRAFLSTTTGGDNGGPVHAIDRIGEGPWYDRLGHVVAEKKADLLNDRPSSADATIINDLPNEDGVPNHAPDPSEGEVDNHDILTGTNDEGQLYSETATCKDWTSSDGETGGRPRVGHSWPRDGGGFPGGGGGGDFNMANWMSSLDEAGCGAGVNLVEMGPPNLNNPTVGSGGGYGGIYCFALTP